MSVHRHLVPALVLLVAASSGPALAQGQTPTPPQTAQDLLSEQEYRIGPGDVLQISVWKNDALSRTVPVRPDGKISMPLLNDVQAGGVTPMELRDVLIKKLTEYISTPEVSVIVSEPHSFTVSVIGEVPKPGRYALRGRTTVLDMLAMAGGFSQFSARTRIFVLRPDGKTQKRIPFNYNKAVAAEAEQENFYLRSGDILVIP